MRPHKNAKISHYDTGKPWDKKKPKKPQTVASYGVVGTLVSDLQGFYAKSFTHFISEMSEKTEYVDIYTATALKPGVNVFPKGTDVQWIEGTQVVVKKKQIVKKPKTGLDIGDWSDWSSYYATFSNQPTAKETMRAHIEAFLNEPMPEPEKSALILSKEFEEQRRRDLYKEKLAAFIESEVELQTVPLHHKVAQIARKACQMESRITYLQEALELREKDVDALNQQIEQLRNYKYRIETATAHIGESSRHFRAED